MTPYTNTTSDPSPAPENDRQHQMLDEIMDRYDRQSAVEAHTIYRVDGRPICVVSRNGQILFDTAEDFRIGGGLAPSDMASDLGLTGDQYVEYVSRQVGQHLKRRYADGLKIARFETGAAPIMGEVREEMFGITRERWRLLALAAALGLGPAELPSGVLVLAKN